MNRLIYLKMFFIEKGGGSFATFVVINTFHTFACSLDVHPNHLIVDYLTCIKT